MKLSGIDSSPMHGTRLKTKAMAPMSIAETAKPLTVPSALLMTMWVVAAPSRGCMRTPADAGCSLTPLGEGVKVPSQRGQRTAAATRLGARLRRARQNGQATTGSLMANAPQGYGEPAQVRHRAQRYGQPGATDDTSFTPPTSAELPRKTRSAGLATGGLPAPGNEGNTVRWGKEGE